MEKSVKINFITEVKIKNKIIALQFQIYNIAVK